MKEDNKGKEIEKFKKKIQPIGGQNCSSVPCELVIIYNNNYQSF